jgi:hypothetical protein
VDDLPDAIGVGKQYKAYSRVGKASFFLGGGGGVPCARYGKSHPLYGGGGEFHELHMGNMTYTYICIYNVHVHS